jgi:hypothetical protein
MNVRRVLITLLIAAFLLIGVRVPAHAVTSSAPPSVGKGVMSTTALKRFGSFNGQDVSGLSSFRLKGRTYITVNGNFTSYTVRGVTKPAYRFAIIDAQTGDLVFRTRSANGWIQVNHPIMSNRNTVATVYLGGNFSSLDGKPFHHVASYRITSSSPGKLRVALNLKWHPYIQGQVRALTSGDGRIYVGAWRITAVNPVSGAKAWSVWTDCSALALLYHGGSVYAGGISRTFGTYTSRGAVKLNSDTGKINKRFRPVIAADKKRCKDPGATPIEVDGGANPLSFAWDPVHGRLLEGDGGMVNVVRSLNPTTGAQYWKHMLDGDAQTLSVIGRQVFVGHHRSGTRITHYRHNNGAMGSLYDTGTGQQRVWQPDPDFTGMGKNADHRNNGIIGSVNLGTVEVLGGAFTAGGVPASDTTHQRFIAFPHS